MESGRPAALRWVNNAEIEQLLEFGFGDLQLLRRNTAEAGELNRVAGSDVMNDMVFCGNIGGGGRAGKVRVFIHNGKVGTISDGGGW